MGLLLDTNVISELRRGPRMHPAVAAWVQTINRRDTWLSVIALGEIQTGVLRKQRKDPATGAVLAQWRTGLQLEYRSRILPVSLEDALLRGEWESLRNRPVDDVLQAATAHNHGLTLVTRNESDFAGLPVRILNPWHFQPAAA